MCFVAVSVTCGEFGRLPSKCLVSFALPNTRWTSLDEAARVRKAETLALAKLLEGGRHSGVHVMPAQRGFRQASEAVFTLPCRSCDHLEHVECPSQDLLCGFQHMPGRSREVLRTFQTLGRRCQGKRSRLSLLRFSCSWSQCLINPTALLPVAEYVARAASTRRVLLTLAVSRPGAVTAARMAPGLRAYASTSLLWRGLCSVVAMAKSLHKPYSEPRLPRPRLFRNIHDTQHRSRRCRQVFRHGFILAAMTATKDLP